ANCSGNFPYGTTVNGPDLGRTSRVGTYPANPWGLYDMHGNVFQWCEDYYDGTFYAKRDIKDPVNLNKPETERRVLRGRSWLSSAGGCRAAFRLGRRPAEGGLSFGFRVSFRLD